jgi:GT2 family glycosyltransferase
MSAPVVSIIIPAYNKWEYTARCLRALAANTRDVAHEVIVIDNASSDDTPRGLALFPGIRTLHNDRNLGFARASNQGAAVASGRFLLFLNNDTEPHAGWAAAMVAEVERDPAVAVVGSKLLYPDGTIQHAGVGFAYATWQPIMPFHVDSRRPASAAGVRRELDAVTAACMLVRPEVFRALGGFDEGYVNGYEDVDFCLEVRARGLKIVFSPDSVVTHHESVSEGRFDSSAANTERLMARWIERFDDLGLRFDADLRRSARALAVAPDRPGFSVVVVADRSIWTIAPCLENVWYTTGRQDEIVIVDDSAADSAGRFARRFAARHAERVRVVAALPPGRAGGRGAVAGFPAAFGVGLAAATRPLAVLLGPNVRVVGDWLERLAAHLGGGDGAITPTLGDATTLSTPELLTPTGRTDPRTVVDRPSRGAPGAALVPATVTPSLLVAARTELLRSIAAAAPDALFGADPTALARCLAETRRRLQRASDVVVYRLNQIAGGADPALRERYLELQGAPLPDGDTGQPLVSVVIVAGGDVERARRCLAAVQRFTDVPCELILVANLSTGEMQQAADELRARGAELAVIANPRDEGFAFAANQGLERARGTVLALLHDDVLVGPGWIRRALALLAADQAIGAVGPASNECPGAQRVRMVSYDGAEQAAAFAETWAAEHRGELALAPRLAGMCLVLRREVVMRVGGFDTAFGRGKGADDDYAIRVARAGWRLAIALDIFVHHDGGASYRQRGLDPRRAADAGWRACCVKWAHAVSACSPADLARLGAAPFDLARDRIPLRYQHIFCAEAPPLALACRPPRRFLCFADDDDDTAIDGWRAVALRFIQTFTARDPVALVIRVEPPGPGAVQRALSRLGALLARAGTPPGAAPEPGLPEVLFESTPLPPARRGSIYTAAHTLLLTGADDDPIHAREAAACGLRVVGPNATVAELLRD